MSMPAVQFDDDHPVLDPDTLKMPEASAHRHAIDLIGLAAARALGPEWLIFRDLNWYPRDGGGPVAPDLMVLPQGATERFPTSYRQDQTGGPVPAAVVEIPSENDSFSSFRSKAVRYQRLGAVVYLVVVDGAGQAVLRLGPGDREPQAWADRPIGELGGIRLAFAAGELVATTPDGLRATGDRGLLDAIEARSAAASEERAEAAEERAEALARQLRALGVEPEAGPSPGPG